MEEMSTAEYSKMPEQIAEISILKAKTPEEAAEIIRGLEPSSIKKEACRPPPKPLHAKSVNHLQGGGVRTLHPKLHLDCITLNYKNQGELLNITDPENVIDKIEMFISDLELYAKEDKETCQCHPFTDRLNGYYTDRAEAYAFTARCLKAYLEGEA